MPGEYGLCPDCRRLPIFNYTNKCTIDNQTCERVSRLGVCSDLCDSCEKAKKYESDKETNVRE